MSTPEASGFEQAFSSEAAFELDRAAIDYPSAPEYLRQLRYSMYVEDILLHQTVQRAGQCLVRYEFGQTETAQATAAQGLFNDGAALCLQLAKLYLPVSLRNDMRELAEASLESQEVAPDGAMSGKVIAQLTYRAMKGHTDADAFHDIVTDWAQVAMDSRGIISEDYRRHFYRGFGYAYTLMGAAVKKRQGTVLWASSEYQETVAEAADRIARLDIDTFNAEDLEKFLSEEEA